MVRMTEAASPMPSYSGHPGGVAGGSASLDDYGSDFSVISPPLASTVYLNGSMAHFNEIHFDPLCTLPDLSFTQMQEAIQDLLKENATLKDCVQKDHSTMQVQYETMLQSKEKVDAMMKQQVDIRNKAKVAMERLKRENAELIEKLKAHEDSATRDVESSSVVEELKAQLAAKGEELNCSTTLYHQLWTELDELRKDYNQLKASYDRLMTEKRDLAAINFELQSKMAPMSFSTAKNMKSMDSSEGSDDQNDFLIIEPKRKTSFNRTSSDNAGETTMVDEQAMQIALAKLTAEQGRSQELQEELDASRIEQERLRKEVAGQEEVIRRLAMTAEKVVSQVVEPCLESDVNIEELQKSDHKLDTLVEERARMALELEMHKKKQGEMEAAKVIADLELQRVNAELTKVKKVLAEELVEKSANMKKAADYQRTSELLKDELASSKKLLEEKSVDNDCKARQSEAYYCLQAKTFQEKYDAQYTQFVTCRDSLKKKEEEHKAMLEQLMKQKDDIETIEILRAQVDLYKADFQAERESREKLHEEKENVLQQLKHLQATVPGSKQERSHRERHEKSPREPKIDDKRERRPKTDKRHSRSGMAQQPVDIEEPELVIVGADGTAAVATETPEEAQDEFPYKCPKCELGFKEYVSAERHVNICLDLDNPFL